MTGKARKDRSLIKGESMRVFFEAIRSRYTRESYERRLMVLLAGLGMPIDEFVARAKKDPAWAQGVVLDCMLGEKQRFLGKEIEASSPSTLTFVPFCPPSSTIPPIFPRSLNQFTAIDI